jgi:SAM-dependent methyltransferase
MRPRDVMNPRSAARRARLAWDQAIDSWEDFQEQGKDYARDQVHGPALLRAIGPSKGLRVLDLGCGQGRFTRVLASSGAKIVAVDWSRGMLAAARRRERANPVGIRYVHADARTLRGRWPSGSFDLVVGCMSFMDMPDLGRVLRAARHLLAPHGRLVFSVSHPTCTAAIGRQHLPRGGRGPMQVDRYFDPHVGVTEWRMKRLLRPFDTIYWHRTLQDWFELLDRSGFVVTALTEPRPTAAQVRRTPMLEAASRFPFFLVVDCRPRAIVSRAPPSYRAAA